MADQLIQGLEKPFRFRMAIEGSCPAHDEEMVRAFVMANVSFTAILGQMVSNVRVAAIEQATFTNEGVKQS